MSTEEGALVEDADRGLLFELPREPIVIDESDPGIVRISFSGTYEYDRTNAEQIGFYNRLRAGREQQLVVVVHVSGARKEHKLDGEGYPSEIVETKRLVVREVFGGVDDD
jgi:hypothetical protein